MSKNKGQTNFYECCDLTKKVYLVDWWFVKHIKLWVAQTSLLYFETNYEHVLLIWVKGSKITT